MQLQDLIIKLCNISGPSGFEEDVCKAINEAVAPFADEISTDAMGNLLAIKRCGKENAKMIMIDAHTDEVGLIVTGYEKGFLRFGAIGGVDSRMLPGRQVRILCPEPVIGVIDVMPPHALSKGDMDKSIPIDELYIDICMDGDTAKSCIPLGTAISYVSETGLFGDGFICGKSLDDRSCCAIAIKCLENLNGMSLDVDVAFQFASQEELGFRGCIAGTYNVNPDYAIAIDVTHGSTPDAAKHLTLEMGGGAVISRGPNMTKSFTDAIELVAKEQDIKYQIEVISGRSGTDAWPIQVSRQGIATALVSLPLRYMHSPVEVISISDAEGIVSLLTQFIAKAGEVL